MFVFFKISFSKIIYILDYNFYIKSRNSDKKVPENFVKNIGRVLQKFSETCCTLLKSTFILTN